MMPDCASFRTRFQIDREGNDFHRSSAFTLIETATRESCDVKLDCLVQTVNDVIRPRDFRDEGAIVGHQSDHDLLQRLLHHVSHTERLARRVR